MASDTDEENYVTIGTPFNIVEEKEPLRKPTKLEEQIATDQKGRRRFHGAFTGGFSAGYFNTVGSKEGWTPSSFKSSRTNRYEKGETSVARPEDFMDDEDFADHGIAPRNLKPVNTFESNEQDFSKKKRQIETLVEDGDITSAVPGGAHLIDLIAPAKLSIGVNLLKKMGWKPGQGVGEKVQMKDDQTARKKTYGCSLPANHEADFIDISTLMSMLAPKDIQPYLFSHKDNTHGLGYSGIDPTTAMFGGKMKVTTFKPTGKEKKGIKGQAFGVGVFEEEDDDIYGSELLSNYDLTMDTDGSEMSYGWSGAPKNQKHKNCLSGFMKSSKQVQPPKSIRMIDIPRDFIPKHTFPDAEREKRKKKDSGEAGKKDRLTSGERSLLIGEKQKTLEDVNRWSLKWDRPKSPTSNLEEGKSDGKRETKKPSRWDKELRQEKPKVSSVDGSTTKIPNQSTYNQKTGLFKPFSKLPEKQKRYEQYCESVKKGENPVINYDRSVTEWERQRELDEFARASVLYRPLSNAISSRFTRASIITTDIENKNERSTSSETDSDKPDDVKAAKLGMYGKLTRTAIEWYPDKILCKRFNIPDPYPSSKLKGVPSRSKKKSSVFTANFADIDQKMIKGSEDDIEEDIADVIKTSSNLKNKGKISFGPLSFLNKENPSQKEENESIISESVKLTDWDNSKNLSKSGSSEKPSIDVFKAIFDTDSSDSESEIDEKKEPEIQKEESSKEPEVDSNIEENLRTPNLKNDNNPKIKQEPPPRQIIGKAGPLSFLNHTTVQALAQPKIENFSKHKQENENGSIEKLKNTHSPIFPNSNTQASGKGNSESLKTQNVFTGTSVKFKNENSHSDSSDSWQENELKHKRKKSKKHKSKHKKDKKRKKKKEKKKKKKERYSSSSETETEDESLVPSSSLLLEKLQKFTTSKRPSAADFM